MSNTEKKRFIERHVRLHGGTTRNQIIILCALLFVLFGCEACFIWGLFQTDFQHANARTVLLFVCIFMVVLIAIEPIYTHLKITLRNRREMLASAERLFEEIFKEEVP